ncbi:MAG: DUF1430 domain-containing protein [Clostridium sp.]|nr:DUF1430 domain-containing protein [Clostridium sp.]
MKKLSYIFTAILGILITITIYSQFNKTYYFNLNQFYNEKYNNMKSTSVFISPETCNMTMPELIDSLMEFGDENNTDIFVIRGKTDDLHRNITEYFIYSQTFQVDNFIYTDEDRKVSFCDNKENLYYATNDDNPNAIKIKVLDDFYKSGVFFNLNNYRPLHQLKDVIDNGDIELKATFYEETSADINNLKSQLKSKYSITDDIFVDKPKGTSEKKQLGMNLQLIVIMVVLNIILMTIFINKKLKEISIRKMNGNKNHQIMKRVIGRYVSMELLIFIFSLIITFFVLVGEISPIAYNIIKPLLTSTLIFLAGLIIIVLILYFYIKYISSLVSLKKSSVNMKLVFSNLVVKLILMTIIISPMIAEISNSLVTFENLYSHLKYYDKEKYRYTVTGTCKTAFTSGIDDGIKIFSDFFKVLEKEKGIYTKFDFSDKDSPLLTPQEKSNNNFIPYISVNKKYLHDYIIRSEDGDKIDIDSLSEDTLLIPKKYKGKSLMNLGYINQCAKKIYVTFDKSFYNPNIVGLAKATVKDPIVFLVTNFSPAIQPMYDGVYYSDSESLSKTLNEMGYENKYIIFDNKGIYDYYIKAYFSKITRTLEIIFLYTFIMLVFLYQSLYLHLEDTKKEVSVKYLMGHRFWSRYMELIILNLTPNVILLILALGVLKIPFTKAFLFTITFMIIEIIFILFRIKNFEKNNISIVLKGE